MSFQTFTFETDNPCNTRILDDDKKTLYFVSTEFPDTKTVTIVKNAYGETIASSEWREVLSDIVTIGKGEPMPLMDWMKKSIIPFKGTLSFKDDRGRKYTWDNYGHGLDMQVFAADTSSSVPIARFIKSFRDAKTGEEKPATMRMTDRALEIRDTIITSFLFLEKSRRIHERSTKNRAEAAGTAGATLLMNGGSGGI